MDEEGRQKGLWPDEETGTAAEKPGPEDRAREPLAARMVPRDFSEFFGQEELVGEGRALRRAIEEDRVGSMIFWGPPGTGKTALGKLIARMTRSRFVELSAVTAGVADIRRATDEAALWKSRGRRTILFVDEIHRFNKAQQDVLLPHVERGTFVLIGATTENPFFAVNPALISRSRIIRFSSLRDKDIEAILRRAISDGERGYGDLEIELEDGVIEHIVRFARGDARVALNVLEALVDSGEKVGPDGVRITLKTAEDVTQTTPVLYDRAGDQHYDVISAYIKSIRGSDPDAAVYWLARMLKGGEDPRFIARRLVIAAAEDIGNADPMALVLAEAALRTVEHVGMPEARIPLAQATLYLACAPKSNASYLAIERAVKDVEEKPGYPVPSHLRGTGYYGAARLGHGEGYLYPHDFPDHHVPQQYLPVELEGMRYYVPDPQGFEKTLKERLDALRKGSRPRPPSE